MARGRHRNAALHQEQIPAALGGGAVLCAAVTWLIGEPGDGAALALRLVCAGAAAAAVTGAVLLRRRDVAAARAVARERDATAGLSRRLEEREAELAERGQRVAELTARARDTHAELARLRSEHAALLRRYATAETERAEVLEDRRQLALEAAEPAKALSAEAADHRTASGAPTPLTYLQASEALIRLPRNASRQREAAEPAPPDTETAAAADVADVVDVVDVATAAEPDAEAAGQAAEPDETLPAVPPPPSRAGGFDFFHTARRRPRTSSR